MATTRREPAAHLDQAADLPPACLPWPFVERRARARGAVGAVIPSQTGPEAREPGAAPPEPALPEVRGARPERGEWRAGLRRGVLAGDLAAAAVGLCLAYVTYEALVGQLRVAYLWSALGAPSWLVGLALARAYDSRCLGAGPEEYRRVFRAGVGAGVAAAVLSYAGHLSLSRGFVLLCCGYVTLLTLLGRGSVRLLLRRARQQGRCLYDVLLVGEEGPVLDALRQVRREQSGGLHVVGACLPSGVSRRVQAHGVPVLGDLHDVAQAVRRFHIDTVAVTACAELHGPRLRRLSWDLEGTGVDLVVAPGLVEVAGPRLHIRPLCGLPLLHVEEPELAGGRRLLKGVADRLLAAVALVLAAPLLLLIALAIRVDSPGPALFRQVRAGRSQRDFWMYKFRTMHRDADRRLVELQHLNLHDDQVLFKMRDDPRVTRVGRLLRRYSLDEVPQLLNVLRGDMSLVGPRPPLLSEVARYGAGVERRLLVKPGLTGLWQISGRADLSWDEAIRLDLRYVENWSLSLDLIILCRTVVAVARGRGAY